MRQIPGDKPFTRTEQEFLSAYRDTRAWIHGLSSELHIPKRSCLTYLREVGGFTGVDAAALRYRPRKVFRIVWFACTSLSPYSRRTTLRMTVTSMVACVVVRITLIMAFLSAERKLSKSALPPSAESRVDKFLTENLAETLRRSSAGTLVEIFYRKSPAKNLLRAEHRRARLISGAHEQIGDGQKKERLDFPGCIR